MGGAWMKWGVCGGLAMGLLGCTSSVVGGGDGGQSTSSGGDGGAGGDGGGANAGAGAGGQGSASLFMDGGNYSAYAVFRKGVGECAPKVEIIGECHYFEMNPSCLDTDADAGIITIQSPMSTSLLTMEMPSVSGDGPLFQPGQTVEMSSTGAEIPAFSGSVVAPPAVALTSPSFGAPITHSKSQDLVLTWPATTGHIVAFVASADALPHALSCTFDGAAGIAKIPPKALAAFPGTEGYLVVYSIDSTTVMAGDWPVVLFVEMQATDAQGTWATTPITFQ